MSNPTEFKTINVGFVLQENFSMMAFTGALDALVTANLINNPVEFSYQTLGVDQTNVTSDVGLVICAATTVRDKLLNNDAHYDVVIVCGGLRCSLAGSPVLTNWLKQVRKRTPMIGGLWNGAIAMAHAGLLNGETCALHPDNHPFMREKFPDTRVSAHTIAMGEDHVTSAGPNSALEMMLKVIGHLADSDLVRSVRDILSCDRENSGEESMPLHMGLHPGLPSVLRDTIELMRNNIEEPLSLEDLMTCVNSSRRQMERLFQHYFGTSPYRYYLELRLLHAKRLLMQTNATVTHTAIASGFVSCSHFSRCFKNYFGHSPSAVKNRVWR